MSEHVDWQKIPQLNTLEARPPILIKAFHRAEVCRNRDKYCIVKEKHTKLPCRQKETQ